MPINSTHPEYKNWLGRWTKCRDAFAGEETVKAKGLTYLPKLTGHVSGDDPKYVAFKTRALFLGAFQRTVEGLSGMATRKDYNLEAPDEFDLLEEDITADGMHLRDLVKYAVDEMMITGRLGILADYNDRPYASLYPAENIINWAYDGDELTLVVLAEIGYKVDAEDPYVLTEETQYRELFLDQDGKAWSQVWKPEKKSGTTDVKYLPDGDPVELLKVGQNLGYIPFEFLNPKGTGSEIVKPLLLDLVNVNISHYRNSASYEHGLHFTALPTPWFSGISATSFDTVDGEPEGVQINIGSETAVLLPDPSASAGMLEFSGAGLAAIKEAMNDKVNFMAMLGARILEPQKKGVEAADTARMNQLGDTSILGSLIGSVERGINNVLEIFADWEGSSTPAFLELNKDMSDIEISPQMITALLQALQGGAISLDTFIYNMKSGELLPEGVSVEDEKDKIALRAPAGRVPLGGGLPNVPPTGDEDQ